MLIPPWLAIIRLKRNGKGPSLWIPVFLLWPVLAVGELLFLLFAVLAWPFLCWSGRGGRLLRLAPQAMELLASLRGLEVESLGKARNVRIVFR